jgi:short-subunit dehydrogenase
VLIAEGATMIVALFEALPQEVREFGIHVHCFYPGLVRVPAP